MQTPRFGWLSLLIGSAIYLLSLLYLRLFGQELDRQINVYWVIGLTLTFQFYLVIWCLTLSNMSWKNRFKCLFGGCSLIFMFFVCFEVREVTGDLIPIFSWRFDQKTSLKPMTTNSPVFSVQETSIDKPLFNWNGFRGPNRNSTSPQDLKLVDWTTSPPQECWRQPIGKGYAGFATYGNIAITLEQRGEQESIHAFNLVNGSTLWHYTYPAQYKSVIGGEGPRSTPFIQAPYVVSMGATGLVHCLLLKDGSLVWERNLLGDHTPHDWGISCSPLVEQNRVYCFGFGPNQSIYALELDTGKTIWNEGSYKTEGYASPEVVTLNGTRQLLYFNGASLASHDITTGRFLWQHAWKKGHPHVVQPLQIDNDFIISSGYGTGAQRIRLEFKDEQWKPRRIWRSLHLKAKFANPLIYQNYLYGYDDGTFTCIDLETGRRNWKEGRYGHGQVIRIGSKLIATTEQGALVLLEANPNKSVELGRVQIFDAKTWNPPSLAGQYLLFRNHQEAVCLKLIIEQEAKPHF